MSVALSVRQPWAGLIVAGIADVENRTRRNSHRGDVVIHASGTVDENALRYLNTSIWSRRFPGGRLPSICDVTGAFIGEAYVVDCISYTSANRRGGLSVWHEIGRYGFYLECANQFQSAIVGRGALGFYRVSSDLESDISLARRLACNGV